MILERVAGDPIDGEVADRLVKQTEGNPLALREIAAELTPEQLCGELPLPEPLPVGPLLQAQFAGRARMLPPAARTVLLLASAERLGDLALLNRAALDIGVPWESAIASVEDARLATFAAAVTFRHPLIRSAVYHDAAPADRRRAHRALAEHLTGFDDVDGARGTGLPLPAPMRRSPERWRCPGSVRSTVAGHRPRRTSSCRASELTPTSVRSVDSLLEVVRLRAAEGDAAQAQPLLDSVMTRVRFARQRAVAEWHTQGLVSLGQGRGRSTRPCPGPWRRSTATTVASRSTVDHGREAALYVGSLDAGALGHGVAGRGAQRLLPGEESLSSSELLVRATAVALTDGYLAGAGMLRGALAGLRAEAEPTGVIPVPNPRAPARSTSSRSTPLLRSSTTLPSKP